MILNFSLLVFLIFSFCNNFCQGVFACDEVPAQQTFRIRLSQPISSYSSKPGMPVRGFIIESPLCDGQPVFPKGTPVEGHVFSVHKVGMGLRYESASLGIQFDRIQPEDAPTLEMSTQVMEVDNAREKVKNGVIHGVRSTNTLQDHVLSSRITYLMKWNPESLWVVPAYRAAFPFLPDPELNFPTGTDLLLKLQTPLPVANTEEHAQGNVGFDQSDADDLDQRILALPRRTSTPEGADADVINLAFLGSKEQVEGAFEAAGWDTSDQMSTRTTFREIRAYLLLRNYPRGPMVKQMLDGQTPDFRWQKGADSISKRDHLRIWKEPDDWSGQPVWISAALWENGMTVSLQKSNHWVHHVDPAIDVEREKIVRDLTLAGCVKAVHNAPRPDMPHFVENATHEELRTDGAIAVVQLQDCVPPVFENELTYTAVATGPRTKFARYMRTQILSFRDLWRENEAYGAFELGRVIVHSIRRNHSANRQQVTASSVDTQIAAGAYR